MKTTMKKISDTKVEINVTLDANDLQVARDFAITQLTANLKVQGFRQGKAPRSIAEKQLDPNAISERALDHAVRSTMGDAFKAEKVEPIAIEHVNVMKYVPDETAEYQMTAEILPAIKLGDFKKLKAKMDKTEPTEADIQDVLDNIVNAYAEKVVAKKPAALGDEVIIDFVGKKDGEAFPGGTASDHHLLLGSGQFIPGFEEGIVGHAAGDKFDLEITFPKEYPEKSLAGQPTVFEILVKQVNEVKKPQLDDELAKKAHFDSLKDLKTDIKQNLEAQNRHVAVERYRDDLVKELVKKSKVDAPEILIGDQLQFIREDIVRNAASHGMSFEQYLERVSQTVEEWEKQARELAAERVKASLVLQILAREQGITSSDEEVEAKIAELKDVYKNSKEAIKNLTKPEVRQDIKNRYTIDKTIDFLVEANGGDAIMNAPVEPKTKATKKAK